MKVSAPLQILRCGNCGADVPITSPGTYVVTCEHCGTLSRRTDVELETIGEVALPAPLASLFQIGTEGSFGHRPFVVRGQVQLDHGAGLWNEWAAETDEGWIWIAEAQGQIEVFEERNIDADALPSRASLPDASPETGEFDPDSAGNDCWKAGDLVRILGGFDQGGAWMIREIGRGSVVACRGEFPIDVDVGSRTTYVDLCRGSNEVATLDFTRPGPAEFLSGTRVDAVALALDPSTQPDHRPERIRSADIRCPNCGGEIVVTDPEHAVTLGCVHCGTPLERDTHLDEFRAVEAEAQRRAAARIPLGASATLKGDRVTVLGFLRRSVREGGQTYPWHEYLLRTDEGAYRWLIESDGHWTYARPIQPSASSKRGTRRRLGAREFKHFTVGAARVEAVIGEFYWRVRAGDVVVADDYVHPATGAMLSVEETPLEFSASLGQYLPQKAVEEAFPDADLPRASGVGAAQPNPTDLAAAWRTFLVLLVGLVASCVAVRVHHANEVVLRSPFGPTAQKVNEEFVQISEPFEIRRGGANVRVQVRAPGLSQGYLDVLGALVQTETGDVTTFKVAAQHYSGVSGGESWSEGNRKGSTLIGRVPAGSYRLRVASRGYDRAVGVPFEVVVQSQVPRALWFGLALVLLLLGPLLASVRALTFESQRWSNSDHPWSSES